MNRIIDHADGPSRDKMKSITIHGIDEPLVRLIESRAQAQGLSVNKTIKKVLEEAFGIKPRHRAANRSEFEEFCGLWSESELAEFEERTRDLRKIDPEDWK
jgi:hypothetical protein